MNEKEMRVQAIEYGTVIDHIPAGLALNILRQLKILHDGNAVTVGFNLNSSRSGKKDIIKITGIQFNEETANRLVLFAPKATVNIIENFKVVSKLHLKLPETVSEMFRCPNPNCASHGEPVKSRFYVRQHGEQTKLKCHYCEKTYFRETITDL